MGRPIGFLEGRLRSSGIWGSVGWLDVGARTLLNAGPMDEESFFSFFFPGFGFVCQVRVYVLPGPVRFFLKRNLHFSKKAKNSFTFWQFVTSHWILKESLQDVTSPGRC